VRRFLLSINLLAFLAGCIMIAAMLLPWWSFRLEYTQRTDLYPYLIAGPGSELVGYKRSPQMTLLTGFLIFSILLCLAGSVLRGRSAKILPAASGVLIFLATWRLLVRVSSVAARFDLPIQGHGRGSLGGFAVVEVWTWLRPGLYLMAVAGVLAIISGVFSEKFRLQR
jgi:hypothetical protein